MDYNSHGARDAVSAAHEQKGGAREPMRMCRAVKWRRERGSFKTQRLPEQVPSLRLRRGARYVQLSGKHSAAEFGIYIPGKR